MLTISFRYRVDIGTLSYLVYIVDVMLTISFQYCVDTGTLSYLVNIIYIVMLMISCRYHVDIDTLLYLVYIVNIINIAKSKVYNCLIKSEKNSTWYWI